MMPEANSKKGKLLTNEVVTLRQRVAELEKLEIQYQQTQAVLQQQLAEFAARLNEAEQSLPLQVQIDNLLQKSRLKWADIAVELQKLEKEIAKKQQVEAQLQHSEERLRQVLEVAEIAWWDWDIVTNTVVCSPQYELLFGQVSANFAETYEAFINCIHREDQQSIIQAINNAMAEKTNYDEEFRVVSSNQNVHWISAKGRFFYNEQGQAVRMIGSYMDITANKQRDCKRSEQEHNLLLERERAARKEAETAYHIKDEFLAILSHELRTPLNPILGWAQLLRKAYTASPYGQPRKLEERTVIMALETIERNAKLQTQLIDDLLDMSHILQGKLNVNVCPVNLIEVIKTALETVRLAAEAKSIHIQITLNSDVGQVMGDFNRLHQVVWNLLSNAVKFTSIGGQVEVRLLQVNSQAQIQVRDTGRGISPDFLPYVFDYFRQSDSSATRQFGGLGLGLAIVRKVVELHGGTVRAESPGEGLGATFTVQIPLLIKG